MKVKVIDLEAGMLAFLKRILGTMPTTGHKFLGGAMLASSAQELEKAMQAYADADGYVETDKVREIIRNGLAASGDKVVFTIGDARLSWLVAPVNVTITGNDLEEMLQSVERNYR